MEEVVRQDILEVVSQGILALKSDDSFRLKELSNHVIHNASIFQDEDSIGIAVLMYALSKVIERGGLDTRQILELLEKAKASLERQSPEEYRMAIKLAVRKVSEADSRLKLFVNNVIEQAQLKKGAKISMHGVSVARTANILGISRWELMQYLGHTTFSEDTSDQNGMMRRIALARRLFIK
jgi:hypothetical protein